MATKALDPAFQGVGAKPGTEIWRIENFQPVPVPKSDYGKFYMGDSYIVLQTSTKGSGAYVYDIHFWIGKDTSQDEAGTAAIKTVELDASLGGRAVQHRELQGLESDKFLTYFKPCIIPLEGGVASGFKTTEEEKFETRLYICKGKRAVRMKQVPFARSSLNHDDVFILDTENKIFQFNGANSNIQERAKALEVIQVLKEKYHGGVCEVAIVDDGKLDTESDSGEFWVNMGGFAPIGKKVASEDDIIPEATPAKLFSITNKKIEPVEGNLSKSLLDTNKCFLLDCGAEVFVWVGRSTQVEERKAANQAAEDFVTSQNRPKSTRITRLIQGFETHSFKSNFGSWPSGPAGADADGGRGKVAALLKQQGGAKGAAKSAPGEEEVPPLLEGGGKMEVWYIDGSAKTPLAKEDIGKFYRGDCYIVLYTYHSGDRKEDFFLCCWIGKDSVEEDQKTAAQLANTMFNTLKGRPTQGFVFQDKEPPQFIALFQPMVVLKGGLGSGYKNLVAEKGVNDDTYVPNSVALIRVYGPAVHKSKAVQVDAEPASLNSKECFLLQTSSSLFIWIGKESAPEKQQLAAKFAEFLRPGVTLKHAKEGTETQAFWFALGGKQNYDSKKSPPEIVRDPRLFTYSFNKEGKFQVEEVYNFSQDDLLTEDILILDTRAEVFVWVGHSVEPKEKQAAFEIGRKYIDLAASLEGLNRNVPLYKVTEGNEPSFFTKYFSWDTAKATAPGNSFQKKVALLFGAGQVVDDKSSGGNKGATQRAEALAALNSAFTSGGGKSSSQSQSKKAGGGGGSQRAAAVAALSQALTAEKMPSPTKSGASPTAEEAETADVKDQEEAAAESEPSADNPEEETDENVISSDDATFTYDQLKAKSDNPVTGIDFKKREAYLSDEEFETIFGMPKEEFYKLPKWKQDQLKKKHDLF